MAGTCSLRHQPTHDCSPGGGDPDCRGRRPRTSAPCATPLPSSSRRRPRSLKSSQSRKPRASARSQRSVRRQPDARCPATALWIRLLRKQFLVSHRRSDPIGAGQPPERAWPPAGSRRHLERMARRPLQRHGTGLATREPLRIVVDGQPRDGKMLHSAGTGEAANRRFIASGPCPPSLLTGRTCLSGGRPQPENLGPFWLA